MLIELAKIPLILVFISVVQFVNSLPDEAFLNVFTELCDVYMAVSQLAPKYCVCIVTPILNFLILTNILHSTIT